MCVWCARRPCGVAANVVRGGAAHLSVSGGAFKWELPRYPPLCGVPAPRSNHAMVVLGDAVYMFGGGARDVRFNDVWLLRPVVPSPGGEVGCCSERYCFCLATCTRSGAARPNVFVSGLVTRGAAVHYEAFGLCCQALCGVSKVAVIEQCMGWVVALPFFKYARATNSMLRRSHHPMPSSVLCDTL